MNILTYINTKEPTLCLISLDDLTDEQFMYYSLRKKLEEHPYIPKPKKEKVRTDKGKRRSKYDSSLSIKHRNYLGRANAKGLPFELTPIEFDSLCKGICIYCGNPATGVDRRNNKRGYTIENSQSCCYTCNHMKAALTESNFIEHIQTILQRWYNRYQ